MVRYAITAIFGLLASLGATAAVAGPGDLDNGYGADGRLTAETSDLVSLPDDRLLTVSGSLLRRFDSKGQLDLTFGENGEAVFPLPTATPYFDDWSSSMPTPDGGVLLWGLLWDELGTTFFEVLIRLDGDGRLLNSFGGNGDGVYRLTTESIPQLCGGLCTELMGVAVDPAGRVLLAKRSWNGLGQCAGTPRVERLTPEGVIDSAFGANGVAEITGVDLCAGALAFGARGDGSIVVASGGGVISLDASGAREANFGSAGQLSLTTSVEWSSARLLPDGGLLLAGSRLPPSRPETVLAKFNTLGQPDVSFGDGTGEVRQDFGQAFFDTSGLQSHVSAVASTEDGEHLYLQISLMRSAIHSVCAGGIARLSGEGTIDSSFGERGLTCLDYDEFPFALIGLQRNGAPLLSGRLNGNVYRLLLDATTSPGFLTLAGTRAHVWVKEKGGRATVSVVRTAGRDGAVSAHFYTSLASPDPRHGIPFSTAHIAGADIDFRSADGRLEWADGETGPRSTSVDILNDRNQEIDEVFFINIDDPQGGTPLHGANRFAVFIDDDDGSSTTDDSPSGGGGSIPWYVVASLAALAARARKRRDNLAVPNVGIYQERVMAKSSFASAIVAALSLCILVASVPARASDSVERWNIAMTDYAAGQPPPGLPPFVEARAFSMAHIAMLDALRVSRASAAPANVDAAIAAAAHDVLISAFAPFGPNSFDSVYQSELAAIPNGAAETRGVSIGQQAAAAMLATRADEDIFAAIGAPYTPGTKPGDYQATPPVGMVVGAGWSGLQTFAVRSSKQFRAPRPYSSLRSLDYAMDVNEIELLGKAIGSGRTTDQTAIAFYWYENSSYAWNRIARKVAGRLSLLGHARLYAALNAAISDAYMTSLESKFHYNFWRPITAIHAANTDGNPLTIADDTWEPAFATPPVPDYPSAHSAAGGAAAEVIDAIVGRARPFTHVSTTGPISGVPGAETRSFSSVQNAAVENAYSRMLVGIHFRRACTAGLEQGRDIGRYVVEHAAFLNN